VNTLKLQTLLLIFGLTLTSNAAWALDASAELDKLIADNQQPPLVAEVDDEYVRPRRIRRRSDEEEAAPAPRSRRRLERQPADEEETTSSRRKVRRADPEDEDAAPTRRISRAAEPVEEETPKPLRRKRPRKLSSAAEVVDLSAMDAAKPPSTPTGAPAADASKSTMAVHQPTGADPHFSIYFDLLLAYQPGKAEFSFLNFHPLLFLEIVPVPDLTFSFEVNPSPRFFELDYQATKNVQLRLGKIWIPFDDINPHSFFGGLVANSRIRLGPTAYLPDVWTDLGAGVKLTLVETAKLTFVASLYVVNGFQDKGTDPTGRASNYPSFSDIPISTTDNNTDKAFGGHFHALFNRVFGLGLSLYTGRWTPDGSEGKRINMIGIDSQYQSGKTQLKIGISKMFVGLPGTDSFNRQGEYIEVNHKFGAKDEWKVLARGGYMDVDERITDVNDIFTVGGGIRWKPGLIEWQLEHYQDLKDVPTKLGKSFTFFRTVIQL
jgi:hypothetical protein